MNILALLAAGLIQITGTVTVPTNQAHPVVTTATVQNSTIPLLSYALTRGPVVVQTMTYP
jgi:hypothetical protein